MFHEAISSNGRGDRPRRVSNLFQTHESARCGIAVFHGQSQLADPGPSPLAGCRARGDRSHPPDDLLGEGGRANEAWTAAVGPSVPSQDRARQSGGDPRARSPEPPLTPATVMCENAERNAAPGTIMRLSIVVCNYNYARFLDGAIRSATQQNHHDKEVIVVDDGSTDGSQAVIRAWGDAVVAVYKTNEGQISAYNAGFERATGDVIVFLDSDDALDPNACTEIIAAFAPGIVKVQFRLRLVSAEGATLGPAIPTRLTEGEVGARLRRRGELYESAPGSGNAYLASALRRLMPLPPDRDDKYGADFFTIYGICLLGTVRNAGRGPLGSYRVHRVASPGVVAFGNAPGGMRDPSRMSKRYERLREWVSARLGEACALPPAAPDFSIEKQRYAAAIFSARSYVEGLHAGGALLPSSVLPSILRMNGSWALRAGLTGWALAVLVLPRDAGRPLARYVCNPASR